jgi:hypothetical protein
MDEDTQKKVFRSRADDALLYSISPSRQRCRSYCAWGGRFIWDSLLALPNGGNETATFPIDLISTIPSHSVPALNCARQDSRVDASAQTSLLTVEGGAIPGTCQEPFMFGDPSRSIYMKT